MAGTSVAEQETQSRPAADLIVNDFAIQVATVNGSGSQTANLVLLRSIFQMGIPVSGKNMFPSNIAGLPTWYTIRANKDGYIARKKEIDLLVAMNMDTGVEDVKYGQKTTSRVLQLAHVIESIFVFAVLILLAAAMILIANTIRLSIFSRRRRMWTVTVPGSMYSEIPQTASSS